MEKNVRIHNYKGRLHNQSYTIYDSKDASQPKKVIVKLNKWTSQMCWELPSLSIVVNGRYTFLVDTSIKHNSVTTIDLSEINNISNVRLVPNWTDVNLIKMTYEQYFNELNIRTYPPFNSTQCFDISVNLY